MNKSSLFTFLILIILSTNLVGQWEILNEGGSYRTIDFINDQVGWVAGEGTLLKTNDGGDTWNVVSMDSAWNIAEIDFINETVGWAITGGYWHFRPPNYIIKTSDGGQTWFVQYELNPDNELGYNLHFNAVNDTLVYASGYDSENDLTSILKTVDGGITWDDISPFSSGRSINSIWFQDTRRGVLLGSTTYYRDPGYDPYKGILLRTNDGGKTWDENKIPEFTMLYDLQSINDSTAYFLASEGPDQDWDKNFLCTTTDTLNSWSVVPNQQQSNIRSFYCLDGRTIFAIMIEKEFNGVDSISTPYLMKSTDGGFTWEKKQANGWEREDGKIYFRNTDVGFILGDGNLNGFFMGNFLLQTFDGGNNWLFQKFNFRRFDDICLIDKKDGFTFGGWIGFHGIRLGDLFITTDGGKFWKRAPNQPSAYIKRCFFVDDMTGFILSYDDSFYKSSDGGKNWAIVYKNNLDSTGYEFEGSDIYFINEHIGWLVGAANWSDSSGAGIFGTTDSGKNWDLVWEYLDADIYEYSYNSIHFAGTKGWAVGESGLMVKYTEQDQWQARTSVTDLPLKDVFFSDENHGWIAGGYLNDQNFQSILLKTTNGGDSWKETDMGIFQINDMFFVDSLHGWAVGNDTCYLGNAGRGYRLYHGIIYETWDGGNNWNMVIDGLSAPLTAIHFKDGHGWAVGGNGLVLKYDGVSWVDQNSSRTYPITFSLSQNYPNPFNPKTIINYQLPIMNDVELSIYNLLGQRVATLVNDQQKGGYHQVEWDASGFASGIYYYSIKAGEFQDVKKMVLLR